MISLILPAFNEEEALQDVVTEALGSLAELGCGEYEVIVVDDGSTDETAAVAESLGVRVISHPENAGYGRSIKDGIAAAKFETIITCDADGTYPLEDIPKLLAEFRKGFDMVVAERNKFRESVVKRGLRKILKWLVEYTAGRRVRDVNSGFRVFSKKTIEPFLSTLCDTFSFTTSLTLGYMMSGKFVAYVPLDYKERKGQTKVRIMRDSIRTMQYIVQALLYYNPIKIFILFSAVCCLFAFMGFLGSALFDFLSGFLLGIGGLLVALIVFCIGLLADLLKQILDRQTS